MAPSEAAAPSSRTKLLVADKSRTTTVSRSPFPGRGKVFGYALALAAVALAVKFFFFPSNDRNVDLASPRSAQASGQKQAEFFPRSEKGENLLLFGGALQKVEDFVPFAETPDFWTVMRDLRAGETKGFENAPLLDSYDALLKNPRHYRFAGQPMRIRGIMSVWAAYKAQPNAAGLEDYFQSWVLNGDEGFVLISGEAPPLGEDDLRRTPVEATGIFYQITRYETDRTTRDLFLTGLAQLKRGRYQFAMLEFQELLGQDPHPALIARYLRMAESSLWDGFVKEGDEYRGVFSRLTELGNQGAAQAREAIPDQNVKKDAPLFLVKSFRVLGSNEQGSALDNFFATGFGIATLFAGLMILVGLFFYFFLRMQRTQDDRLKREREEFWREVRRNVKGVTPPGDRFGGGSAAT